MFFLTLLLLFVEMQLVRNSSFLKRNLTHTMNMSTSTILTPPQPSPIWNHTPSMIKNETSKLLKEMKDLDDQLAKIPLDDANLENVFLPIARLENTHSGLINILSFYQHISPSKELRDSSNEADSKIRKFSIESGMREDVFKVVKSAFDKYKQNPNDIETNKLVKKIYNDYKRNGLGLPFEKLQQVKLIKEKLSQLSIEYSSNLSEDESFISFTLNELNGVPNDVIKSFENFNENDQTFYKMTFKYPDILPVLKYAKSSETRKRAFLGDQNKVPKNSKILIDAVKLRFKLANTLGYKNFSDYILEDRMAKSRENVMNFLNDLKIKLAPLGEQEILKLKQFKSMDNNNDSKFYIWDQRYYNTKMLEQDYNVDDLKISEFFPLNSTINGMLSIYETIFKLKFIESKNFSSWHEDVKQFQVWKTDDNLKTDNFVGYIYLDLHPRQGKYGHAANFGIIPGYTNSIGERNYPVTSLVCNFTNDSNGKPALLKHNEVVTFFHELGHGIHDLMGLTKYSRFHGTSVAWDFVEMPSQLLEYFCWDKSILKNLSCHYETGESLPMDLIESIVNSKHVNGALFNLRQLHFGLFDMSLHSNQGENFDIDYLWNNLREEICLISNGEEVFHGYGSFGHMMGGYESGYYGYLWSQVFASDVFYSKFKENPLNVENGVKYRDMVLSKGGSCDESDLLNSFLGRNPSNAAFLQELGLSK